MLHFKSTHHERAPKVCSFSTSTSLALSLCLLVPRAAVPITQQTHNNDNAIHTGKGQRFAPQIRNWGGVGLIFFCRPKSNHSALGRGVVPTARDDKLGYPGDTIGRWESTPRIRRVSAVREGIRRLLLRSGERSTSPYLESRKHVTAFNHCCSRG